MQCGRSKSAKSPNKAYITYINSGLLKASFASFHYCASQQVIRGGLGYIGIFTIGNEVIST